MKISVTAGVGTGPTKLAAFDAALIKAGVANFNLIRLSSIVPLKSTVVEAHPQIKAKWGDRLYVVMADERIDSPNVEAWAGIGWAQDQKNGLGLFVEHHGQSKATVQQDIEDSLRFLFQSRNMTIGPISTKIAGVTCKRDPVCALAIAVFQAERW